MALTPLLLVDKRGRIADMTLDCVLSESHKAEVEVTSHPVEKGADITDHARQKPREVTITAIISETPVTLSQQRRVIKSDGTRIETLVAQPIPLNSDQYVGAALAKLDRLLATKELVTLVTALRSYKDMMLTSLTIPKDPKTGMALNFTAVFREIRFAVIRTTEAQTKVVKTANKKVNLGKQVGKPKPEANRSIWSSLNNATGGFIKRTLTPAGP